MLVGMLSDYEDEGYFCTFSGCCRWMFSVKNPKNLTTRNMKLIKQRNRKYKPCDIVIRINRQIQITLCNC